jgi:hypothetical protein
MSALPARPDDDIEHPEILVLSPDEAITWFDRRCRERLGMGGTEFLRRLDAGEWDEVIDDPDHRHHLLLAMNSRLVRP